MPYCNMKSKLKSEQKQYIFTHDQSSISADRKQVTISSPTINDYSRQAWDEEVNEAMAVSYDLHAPSILFTQSRELLSIGASNKPSIIYVFDLIDDTNSFYAIFITNISITTTDRFAYCIEPTEIT